MPSLALLPYAPMAPDASGLLLQSIYTLEYWMPSLTIGLHILVILIVGLVVLRLIKRATNRWIEGVQELEAQDPRRQRAATMGNLLQSMAEYVVWPIVIIMILSEIGLDVGALLATAGIAGLAIGFGAQTLVKDVIGGIFLLFDELIHVGDLVTIGGTTGTVVEIGVRLVKVRKFDGELVIIPAGEIRTFGNKSVDWARVVVPIGLSYDQDIDAILPVVEEVAQEWAADNESILLEESPQVQGLMDFGDSSVTARVVVQVKPGEQYAAERDLRMRLKRTFDDRGVEIPFPQRTIHVLDDATGPAQSPSSPSPPKSSSVASDD